MSRVQTVHRGNETILGSEVARGSLYAPYERGAIEKNVRADRSSPWSTPSPDLRRIVQGWDLYIHDARIDTGVPVVGHAE